MVNQTKPSSERRRSTLKAVIRHLPPLMTAKEFISAVDPIPDHNYFWFEEGDPSLGQHSFACCYINFKTREDIELFTDKFDGYIFVDAKGNEYPAIVEFAPFQKVSKFKLTAEQWLESKPKGKARDLKVGTIETDDEYVQFLETLKEAKNEVNLPSAEIYLEEMEKKAKELKDNHGCPKVVTPLIEFVLNKLNKGPNPVTASLSTDRGGDRRQRRDGRRDRDKARTAKRLQNIPEGGTKDGDRNRKEKDGRNKRRERDRNRDRNKQQINTMDAGHGLKNMDNVKVLKKENVPKSEATGSKISSNEIASTSSPHASSKVVIIKEKVVDNREVKLAVKEAVTDVAITSSFPASTSKGETGNREGTRPNRDRGGRGNRERNRNYNERQGDNKKTFGDGDKGKRNEKDQRRKGDAERRQEKDGGRGSKDVPHQTRSSADVKQKTIPEKDASSYQQTKLDKDRGSKETSRSEREEKEERIREERRLRNKDRPDIPRYQPKVRTDGGQRGDENVPGREGHSERASDSSSAGQRRPPRVFTNRTFTQTRKPD